MVRDFYIIESGTSGLKSADEPRTIQLPDTRKRDLEEKLLAALNAKDDKGEWKVGLDMAVSCAAAAGFTGRDIIGAFKSCLGKGTLIREAVESAAAVLGVEP